MDKLLKKIILIIGIISCANIVLLNIFLITKIRYDELLNVNLCDAIELVSSIITMIVIILLSKIISMKCKNMKKGKKIILFVLMIIVYIVGQIAWINIRKATPWYDQDWAYTAGKYLYEDKIEEMPEWMNSYLERLPQQISLAWAFNTAFKILHTTNVLVFQYGNVILNVLTLIGLLLIVKQLGKKYEVSPVKTIVIFLCFLPLALLATFVYSDVMSITLCVFSVYFMMKHAEKEKIIYAILAGILTAIACIIRKNNLVYAIAIIIYLVLEMFKKDRKRVLNKLIALMLFIFISVTPFLMVSRSVKEKLNLDTERQLPMICYFYMGMADDNPRGNGWYRNDIMDLGYYKPEGSDVKYKELIKERLKEFKENPLEIIEFYTLKNASMWAENTYSSVLFNHSYYSGNNAENYNVPSEKEYREKIDEIMITGTIPLYILQKAISFLIFGYTIMVLIKNRKDISNEVLLLVTIFLGGFFFHIIWEAKSRYIIIYIIMLMPIVSISLEGAIRGKINSILEKQKNE